MARIIYSALVDRIDGSIKGTTFQRNAYGFTIKGKPNMVNPNTISQGRRKIALTDMVNAWKTLTDPQRAAWDSYAGTYPVATRLNPNAYLGGYNYFLRWHGVRRQYDSVTILTNPSGPQGAITDQIPFVERIGAIFRFNTDIVFTSTNWRVIFYASGPVTPTQVFSKSILRFLGDQTAVSPTTSRDFATIYTNLFGRLLNVGELLFVRIVLQKSDNGQVIFYPPQRLTVV